MSMRAFLFSALVAVIALASNAYFMSALGLGLFTFAIVDFLDKVGKGIPILEAMFFIACLQWVVGPYIDYLIEYRHFKYHMYVPETAYMDLVVPSLFLFALPLYFISNRIDYSYFLNRIQSVRVSDRLAINLILIGFLSDVAGKFAPLSLAFLFFLASGIKFVGLLCLFYNNSQRKWVAFYLLFAFQFLLAVGGGMFHTLLLWLVFVFLFLAGFHHLSFTWKVILVAVGFTAIFILQSIKVEFRKEIWQGGFKKNKTELFLTLFFAKAESYLGSTTENLARIKEEKELDEANNRLNQGWIISRIMSQIPSHKPYLQGETIEDAIYSSLVPRFLVESKVAGGGGSLTYERLTGFHLLSASMGTGVLGEAYGNYGVEGTFLFMFLWGLLLALLFQLLFFKARTLTLLPLFLPIIFLQVIKAETDFFTVLNHLVKSTVFVFGFIYLGKYVFKIRF